MKILVHDYVGHPFQFDLSRQLAHRGHHVTHAYCADNPGPKALFGRSDNPRSLRVSALSLDRPASHTALISRRYHDIAYGRRVASLVREIKPDIVISGNTPTEAQGSIIDACKAADIAFVYWLQDIYSTAVSKLLAKKMGPVAIPIGLYYRWLDRRQFRQSDAIVAISDDFVPIASGWSAEPDRVFAIENWATIADLPIGAKTNEWAARLGLTDHFTFVYSGTLGRKHNPELLLRLAESFPAAKVVVVAQGAGMDRLKAIANPPQSLVLLPVQPAEHLADVLASADVLVASIESDAGAFAVPSKVQAYMCAGRPILLAAPAANLAARTVRRADAGFVVDPADEAGFLEAAGRMLADAGWRAQLAENGRSYAEETFDLERITDRFEEVFRRARGLRC